MIRFKKLKFLPSSGEPISFKSTIMAHAYVSLLFEKFPLLIKWPSLTFQLSSISYRMKNQSFICT